MQGQNYPTFFQRHPLNALPEFWAMKERIIDGNTARCQSATLNIDNTTPMIIINEKNQKKNQYYFR